jgi:MoaA/NifB/PqqE/SkfB family radical SAM enzyme
MTARPAPSTLFIEITQECNYHCRYCHMWTLKDDSDALSTNEKASAIRQFARMNPNGHVAFTGGEPMRKDEFWILVGEARACGLLSAANTNGSYIGPEDHERVLTKGPDFLMLSLDSHSPDVHDYHRGVPGSFAATVNTISSLLRLRRQIGSRAKARLTTNSVLTDRNIFDVQRYASFATELGLDGCTFQVLIPTFAGKGRQDAFYRKRFFPDRAAAIGALQELRDHLSEYPIVKTTDNDLRWMQSYIADPNGLTEPICNSHERNMMVDHRGEVQLCFDMRKIFDGKSIGNVRSSSLAALWAGDDAEAARSIMEQCRRSCGTLNCHRRH